MAYQRHEAEESVQYLHRRQAIQEETPICPIRLDPLQTQTPREEERMVTLIPGEVQPSSGQLQVREEEGSREIGKPEDPGCAQQASL